MKRYCKNENNISYDIFTNVKNLNYLDSKQSALFESRIAMIRELAYSICKGGVASIDEVRESYLSVCPDDLTENEISESPILHDMKKLFDSLSVIEKVYLCREIIIFIKDKSSFFEAVIGSDEGCHTNAKGKICYLKNDFADSAYTAFSKSIKLSERLHFDSFETICEEVQTGECEFGILPIETSSDGKLLAFYSMIDRYGLKIVSICSVDHTDSQKVTRFALVGKSIKLPNINQSKCYMELRIVQSSRTPSALYDILCAAYACNMSASRVDSLPLPYGESLFSHYVVFNIDKSDIDAFLTYLALEFPQCYALGFYYEN